MKTNEYIQNMREGDRDREGVGVMRQPNMHNARQSGLHLAVWPHHLACTWIKASDNWPVIKYL
jgi:hypothetical protein